jgi:hypothetical protein
MMLAIPAGTLVAAGTMITFCQPMVPPRRWCGLVRSLADGWLPDFVRLGELERHIGEDVMEAHAEKAIADRRLTTQKQRRIMSLPLTVRLIVAMKRMPDVISSRPS